MRNDVIDALAAFRLVRLAIDDTIFDAPRERVREALQRAGHTKLLELLECPWCMSIWCAAGVIAARRVAPRAWSPLARLLAFSTVAGVVDRLVA